MVRSWFFVNDTAHLDRLIQRLSRAGVLTVEQFGAFLNGEANGVCASGMF
jgi:hypothetical protein